jgi:hypothetical protein
VQHCGIEFATEISTSARRKDRQKKTSKIRMRKRARREWISLQKSQEMGSQRLPSHLNGLQLTLKYRSYKKKKKKKHCVFVSGFVQPTAVYPFLINNFGRVVRKRSTIICIFILV